MSSHPGRSHDLIVGAIQVFPWGTYNITNVGASAQDPTQVWLSDLADAILDLFITDSKNAAGGPAADGEQDWAGEAPTDDKTQFSGTGEPGGA